MTQQPHVFYREHVFDKHLRINLADGSVFYEAVNRLAAIYIVPQSTIQRIHCGGGVGLIVRRRGQKWLMYVAEELGHADRLITVAHELLHLVLVRQGIPIESDHHARAEGWIEVLALLFYSANPGFLEWVYMKEVRVMN